MALTPEVVTPKFKVSGLMKAATEVVPEEPVPLESVQLQPPSAVLPARTLPGTPQRRRSVDSGPVLVEESPLRKTPSRGHAVATAAGGETKRGIDAVSDTSNASWYLQNRELVAQVDNLLAVQLADRKRFCDHTGLDMLKTCDVVFNNILNQGSENNSVLLLGEAGSGKTHIVEWCVKELRKARPSTLVLRARGSAYATEVECLRHLAAQMTDKLGVVPHANASFQAGVEWIRNIFKSSFKHGAAMVMVLDQFEYFARRGARQALLYNLFDVAQEAGVHLSIIGTSEKIDVMDSLEKRIRSRFSMRHLHTFVPSTMEGLVQVLMAKLKLPAAEAGQLKAPFLNEFNSRLEAAIRAKRDEWKPHLELGRSPSWFLARCVPVASLLQPEANMVARAPKRARLASVLPGSLPSATDREVTMLLLEGLVEAEHIMLLALYRLNSRRLPRTLRTALHEIQLLHEHGAFGVKEGYDADTYSTAFGTLSRLQLLEVVRPAGSANLAKRHLPCKSCVDHIYEELIADLGASVPKHPRNPLRALPARLQQWAARQRPSEAQ